MSYENDGEGERHLWAGIRAIPLPHGYETERTGIEAWLSRGYPTVWGLAIEVLGHGLLLTYDSTYLTARTGTVRRTPLLKMRRISPKRERDEFVENQRQRLWNQRV